MTGSRFSQNYQEWEYSFKLTSKWSLPLRCRQTQAWHWPHPCRCPSGWWWGACRVPSWGCLGSRSRPRRGSPCAHPGCSRPSRPKWRRQNPEKFNYFYNFVIANKITENWDVHNLSRKHVMAIKLTCRTWRSLKVEATLRLKSFQRRLYFWDAPIPPVQQALGLWKQQNWSKSGARDRVQGLCFWRPNDVWLSDARFWSTDLSLHEWREDCGWTNGSFTDDVRARASYSLSFFLWLPTIWFVGMS